MSRRPARPLGALGLGAAACVACCIGPIVAAVGALSVAGLAFAVTGSLVLSVAAVLLTAFVWRRRRQSAKTPVALTVKPPPVGRER